MTPCTPSPERAAAELATYDAELEPATRAATARVLRRRASAQRRRVIEGSIAAGELFPSVFVRTGEAAVSAKLAEALDQSQTKSARNHDCRNVSPIGAGLARLSGGIASAPHKSKAASIIKLADKTANLRAIASSPPPWPAERKSAYVAWARSVVSGLPVKPEPLLAEFEMAADAALSSV